MSMPAATISVPPDEAVLSHDGGVLNCDSGRSLAAIHNPDTQLVIWQRTLPAALREWLERINAVELPRFRILVRPEDLLRALLPMLEASGMQPHRQRNRQVDDIEELVARFAKLARTDLVDVRLEGVSNDACWRFHRDCVEARLLTTYMGPATEWVHPAHAERALQEQTQFAGPIEQLAVNDVALFKGSCAGPDSGIVHRSPPIKGTGQSRLLLCLNQPSSTSPEAWST